jgi:hypothetical protein
MEESEGTARVEKGHFYLVLIFSNVRLGQTPGNRGAGRRFSSYVYEAKIVYAISCAVEDHRAKSWLL